MASHFTKYPTTEELNDFLSKIEQHPGFKTKIQDFAQYISLIPLNKNKEIIGYNAYQSVAGRIAQCNAEHAAQGGTWSCDIEYIDVITQKILANKYNKADGEKEVGMLLVKSTVKSSLFGERSAFASGMMDSQTAYGSSDYTNPVESADTSALGRALGMMGFGLIGGVASAEEINEATRRGAEGFSSNSENKKQDTKKYNPVVKSLIDQVEQMKLDLSTVLTEYGETEDIDKLTPKKALEIIHKLKEKKEE